MRAEILLSDGRLIVVTQRFSSPFDFCEKEVPIGPKYITLDGEEITEDEAREIIATDEAAVTAAGKNKGRERAR